MKLLLDTHVVLWWQRDDRRLKKDARKAIATADLVLVSAVSGWEVAIKSALGRLTLTEPFSILLHIDEFTELPLTVRHTEQLDLLPAGVGNDPFDRMIAAQALVERATLVTHDRAFERAGAKILWT
jgi:PIN domain nuclease of toxin-antitoxin system